MSPAICPHVNPSSVSEARWFPRSRFAQQSSASTKEVEHVIGIRHLQDHLLRQRGSIQLISLRDSLLTLSIWLGGPQVRLAHRAPQFTEDPKVETHSPSRRNPRGDLLSNIHCLPIPGAESNCDVSLFYGDDILKARSHCKQLAEESAHQVISSYGNLQRVERFICFFRTNVLLCLQSWKSMPPSIRPHWAPCRGSNRANPRLVPSGEGHELGGSMGDVRCWSLEHRSMMCKHDM